MSLLRRNKALEINPPQGDQFLTTHGSDWLFAVTAVFALSTVSAMRSPPMETGISETR